MAEQPHVVVVTGMSGAGRSTAARVLEDIGYFVVDNLPPALIEATVEQMEMLEQPRSRLAVVVDTRRGLTFADLEDAMRSLELRGIATSLLFLDADDALDRHAVEWHLEGMQGRDDRLTILAHRDFYDQPPEVASGS